jgi:hypothetical protein
MDRTEQFSCDRVLWTLVSLKDKAEWTELRKRTKLTAVELDIIMSELAKAGKISIVPGQLRDRTKP